MEISGDPDSVLREVLAEFYSIIRGVSRKIVGGRRERFVTNVLTNAMDDLMAACLRCKITARSDRIGRQIA